MKNRRFQKHPGIVERKIRGEHVLVPVMGSMEALDSLFSLNPSASFVWEQACGGLTESEITARLCADFEVPEQQARDDTAKVLDELVTIGALQLVEACKPEGEGG